MATFQVSNQTQLDAAILKVKGGDIVVLAAGNYSSLGLVNKPFTSAVTFTSASAATPANIAYAKAINSSNVVFQNVNIGRAVTPGVDTEWSNMAQVEYSTNVTFNNVKFCTTGADDKYLGRGLFVRGGSNVTVKNSDFLHLAVGMATMSMSNITIVSNKFHDIRIDGAEFTAITGGLVDSNSFRDFRSSPTAHPDAIQIWTAGTNKPTTDLTISNNIILPGTGGGEAERTNVQVVEQICDILDARTAPRTVARRRDLIRFVADRPGHDRRYAIDCTKLKQELGWTQQVDFYTGLARTVDWYLANRAWWAPLRARRYAGERLGVAA